MEESIVASSTPGAVTAQTACPLDCPDSCSLTVTSEAGRVVKIDGTHRNPITRGFICAKVRRFGERAHGAERLLHPAVRVGPKGSGQFRRASWDEALDLVARRMREARDRSGAESVLPFSYGGSNGLLTQDTSDAVLFRRFGASNLDRAVCAAPTSAAAAAMYGKMAGVAYEDYEQAKLVVMWGVNPSATGIHFMPFLKEARERGAALVVVDPRATPAARQADMHLAVRPGADVAIALAVHRHLFESGLADEAFLARHTRGADRLRERASAWTFDRAAEVSGVSAEALERFAELYAESSPAVIRCGWGLERNRNGGNAALAVMALPAVAGKFGVRGGGYTMSGSASWGPAYANDAWMNEPESQARTVNMNRLGRALLELDAPRVEVLFVYNCNPVATMPDQTRVVEGLMREDLFTVVFEQVATDTVAYADVVLPATTFLEQRDVARAYGPPAIQLVEPVIPRVGEARPNVEVFAGIADRLGLLGENDARSEGATAARMLGAIPAETADAIARDGVASAPPGGRRPVQFVDVFPRTPDGRADLFPEALDASAPAGLYAFQADPATAEYPLALISPATEKTISSTLGELSARVAVLRMNPVDAAERGLGDGDEVAVYNERGEVRCPLGVGTDVRPGTVSLPKGLWRRHTRNGLTSNALVPDTLTDIGGGACFNDARVEVRRAAGA